MAVATMSTFAPAPTASRSLAPMGVFVPTTPMVVKRDKRRRRRNAHGDAAAEKASSKRRAVRQGFVFDSTIQEDDTDRSHLASAASTTTSATAPTTSAFVFRKRKSIKPSEFETHDVNDVDAAHASDALAKKQARAREREQKRQRLAKRKAQMEKDEQVEAALVDLSRDQMSLYYAVRDHVKREMRKTMRDFARSAARFDVLQLTEKSLDAIKAGVAEFLIETPPSQTMETLPNPENARLQALIESYEARIKELESEETQWTTMRTTLDVMTPSTETEGEASEQKPVELSVTTEIGNLQRAAISEVESSAQRLLVIQDSMRSIDRLALQAEIQKAKLFDAYHGSVFKGYAQDPKETLRALLKLAPPSTSQ